MKKIIFLHHSTGQVVWYGQVNRYVRKLTDKSDVKTFFKRYNRKNKTSYVIEDLTFPKKETYGWRNYPYDYYNIWVKNAGDKPFMDEPTLEILTKRYDVIVFKHCYPVSNIQKDTGEPDVNSDERRLENYKVQYQTLKTKMHEFPNTKFILWSPPVHVKSLISEDEAKRTRLFHDWMVNEWNNEKDNIFIWDFYSYQTEGELYFNEKYAVDNKNSHPNKAFAARMAPLFGQFIIDVIEGRVK